MKQETHKRLSRRTIIVIANLLAVYFLGAPFLSGLRRTSLHPGRGIDTPIMILTYPAGAASEVVRPYFSYWGWVHQTFFDDHYFPSWEEFQKMR